MSVFFTSDLHFGHKRILEYCPRPYKTVQEMNEALIKNWNTYVKPEDTVYFLGDFGFCPISKMKEILQRLNGYKICTRGNHDQSAGRMKRAGFDEVYDELELEICGQKVKLCHYPYAPTKKQIFIHKLKNFYRFWRKKKYMDLRYMDKRPLNKGGWLIHGHSHYPPEKRVRGKMIDVGVDANHYIPVPMEAIMMIIQNEELKRHF